MGRKWSGKLFAALIAVVLVQTGVSASCEPLCGRQECGSVRNDSGIHLNPYLIDGICTYSQARTGEIQFKLELTAVENVDATATVTVQYYNSEKRRWEYYDHRTYSNYGWYRWELSDTMPCRYTGQYRAVGCVTAGNNGYLDDVESMSNVIYVA